jgi:predicted N-acetyltransferase YhbS
LTFEIVPFNRAFDRGSFACGKPELDVWLKTQAGQQEKSGNTRTFLAVASSTGCVVGYYATTTYRLELDETARAFGSGRRRYPVPAVLLARLAVDERWQGQRLGSRLLVHALRGFAEASERVGFEVVVVHAIDRSAFTFYARAGFTPFEDHDLHLYMPVKDLVRTIKNEL